MTRRTWLPVAYGAGLVAITAVLAVIGYWLMFSFFDVPDDTGYALMSIIKVNQGEALYSTVYSQYGPGFYVLVGGILRILAVPLTPETALFTNLFLWLSSSLFIGLALLKLTGRLVVPAISVVLSFLVLTVDVNEPLHPGATIAFGLAAMVLVAVYLLPTRPRAGMAALGVLVAGLLSIKVNVGLFALISVAFAYVSTVTVLRRHEVLRVLVTIAFITLPFPLMSSNIGDGWAQRYAAIVAVGALALALISTRLPAVRPPGKRGIVAFAIGLGAIGALVMIVPVIGGTSPVDLIDGWVIRPAGTTKIAHAALLTDGHAWIWIVFGAVLAGVVWYLWPRSWDRRGRAALATGRVAAGLVIWISLSGPVFHLPPTLTQGMVIGAPLLWVAALPRRAGGDQVAAEESSFLRLLIPALAALQFLHAYPIPGSQTLWSVFLLVPVGGICIADGLAEFSELAIALPQRLGILLRAAPLVAVVAFGAWLGLKPLRNEGRAASARYHDSVSLGVPGGERMRTNAPQAEQIQDIVAGVRANCDTLLTMPGMNSLNIFSEEEPPVELSSPWPFFFTVSEQEKIVEEVKSIPGLCVIIKPDLVNFWALYYGGLPPRRPLVEFMEEDFRTIHNYSGYYLRVRR